MMQRVAVRAWEAPAFRAGRMPHPGLRLEKGAARLYAHIGTTVAVLRYYLLTIFYH